jgi:hypothetical protein
MGTGQRKARSKLLADVRKTSVGLVGKQAMANEEIDHAVELEPPSILKRTEPYTKAQFGLKSPAIIKSKTCLVE